MNLDSSRRSIIRRRPFAIAAVLIAAAVAISACGDSDASDADAVDSLAVSTTNAPPVPSTTESASPVVDALLTEARTGSIEIQGETHQFEEVGFDPEFDIGNGPAPALLGVFDGEDGLIVVPVDFDTEAPTGELIVFWGSEVWEIDAADVQQTDDGARVSAAVDDADGGFDIRAEMPFGVGTSTFEVVGSQATIRGDLGSHTYVQMQHLIENYPDVDTLVLLDIGGSVNDEVNVETGRLVREAGLTTLVPADGRIFSGGVDLFAAGARRVAEPGAVLGVHSWCCGPNGESAHLLEDDDPAHASQLAFVREMLGAELGPDFYFFTLDAAPFDGIHEMTRAELEEYLLTE